MKYEWDENKRLLNLEKHGLDFEDADLVYESLNKLTLRCATTSEERWQDIAEIDGNLFVLSLVYAYRADAVRFISFRYANIKERRLFYGKYC
jgi:uncharacterized DUF497 family protein